METVVDIIKDELAALIDDDASRLIAVGVMLHQVKVVTADPVSYTHLKVSDAGAFVKNNIYDFIDDSEKTVLVVDCENSDPYKLCATLKNLDYEVMQKITAIILFDDVHTATAWRILENYTRIPVEHIMIERIKQNKSLVDIKLTARALSLIHIYLPDNGLSLYKLFEQAVWKDKHNLLQKERCSGTSL